MCGHGVLGQLNEMDTELLLYAVTPTTRIVECPLRQVGGNSVRQFVRDQRVSVRD